MIIQTYIYDTSRVDVLSYEIAKEFLDAIGEKFKKFDKVNIVTLLSSFTNAQYDNVGEIRDYILRIVQLISQLKKM